MSESTTPAPTEPPKAEAPPPVPQEPAKTEAAPVKTEAAPVKTEAAPVKTEARPTPIEYTIKAPEGVEAAGLITKISEFAKVNGLTAAQAQAAFDHYFSLDAAAKAEHQAAVKQYDAKNLEVLKADPEFGGAAFEANKLLAQKALVRFATPEIAKELDSSGLGNHPGLLKMLLRIGKAISEDRTSQPPSTPTKVVSDYETQLRLRYPTMYKDAPNQ